MPSILLFPQPSPRPRVLCPDGQEAELVSADAPAPEGYGHDGYPMPPTSEYVTVRGRDGQIRYWPAWMCLRVDAGYGYLAAPLAVLGLGMGLSVGPASTAAIETAPSGLAATASGTNSMMRYLGSIVGAGILGAVLSTGDTAPGIGVFRLIFAVLLVLAVAAVVAAAGIHRFPARDD